MDARDIAAGLAGRIDGDREALDEFYRAHFDEIVRFFGRRVSDPAEVADLVADTFVAAVEASGRFDPSRGGDLPWLYGIAARVLAGSRRRRKREQAANVRISGRRLLDDDDIPILLERIDAERCARALHDALALLGDKDRLLLELIALEGLTPREAASALGISQSALRMRLSRARSRIRRRLAQPSEQLDHLLIRTETKP